MLLPSDLSNGPVGVCIIDSQGKLVREFELKKKTTISLKDLERGIFVIRAVKGSVIQFEKLELK